MDSDNLNLIFEDIYKELLCRLIKLLRVVEATHDAYTCIHDAWVYYRLHPEQAAVLASLGRANQISFVLAKSIWEYRGEIRKRLHEEDVASDLQLIEGEDKFDLGEDEILSYHALDSNSSQVYIDEPAKDSEALEDYMYRVALIKMLLDAMKPAPRAVFNLLYQDKSRVDILEDLDIKKEAYYKRLRRGKREALNCIRGLDFDSLCAIWSVRPSDLDALLDRNHWV